MLLPARHNIRCLATGGTVMLLTTIVLSLALLGTRVDSITPLILSLEAQRRAAHLSGDGISSRTFWPTTSLTSPRLAYVARNNRTSTKLACTLSGGRVSSPRTNRCRYSIQL